MLVKESPVKFQVDCGASANILPLKYVDDEELAPCSETLVMWNGAKVEPVGSCVLPVNNPKNNDKYKVKFLVVKENLTPLLGLNATEKMTWNTPWNGSPASGSWMQTCCPSSEKSASFREGEVQGGASEAGNPQRHHSCWWTDRMGQSNRGCFEEIRWAACLHWSQAPKCCSKEGTLPNSCHWLFADGCTPVH